VPLRRADEALGRAIRPVALEMSSERHVITRYLTGSLAWALSMEPLTIVPFWLHDLPISQTRQEFRTS
jgi:hypothetical protein